MTTYIIVLEYNSNTIYHKSMKENAYCISDAKQYKNRKYAEKALVKLNDSSYKNTAWILKELV